MLHTVVDTLLSVPPAIARLSIAALVLGEAALFFGFVLPGETAVVYGGVLADAGKVSVLLVLTVVVLAAVVGDSVGFEVGRVLLGYFAAHSISTITLALGVTSGVIVAVIVVGVAWAWHRRTRDA